MAHPAGRLPLILVRSETAWRALLFYLHSCQIRTPSPRTSSSTLAIRQLPIAPGSSDGPSVPQKHTSGKASYLLRKPTPTGTRLCIRRAPSRTFHSSFSLSTRSAGAVVAYALFTPQACVSVFVGSRARAAHKLQAIINRKVPVRASRTARRGCAKAKSRPYLPRRRYDCLYWAGRVCAHSGRISRPEIRMNGFRDPFCHLVTATLYECPRRAHLSP
ncbi:hypothetical protein BD311DRAFT_765823 [Dichomitus squalens]|uniref:Uncharacterized protein n=1 Tax=Dichomitus squalens TaxID=114155 RepID=A0A4Q9MC07_9APHY|nr:hypothetical protein BD311DRAFT_765823 [Dichomitus squalens]